MRRMNSIKTKFVTLILVLPMLALITPNATMNAAEDITPADEILSRIEALEKRVQKINTEINDLKSQLSRVDAQLSESTILGTWLFQEGAGKCQLEFKPNHRFQIISSDTSQGIVNVSGQGNWKIERDRIIVKYRYDGPHRIDSATTLSFNFKAPHTLTFYGVEYRKQSAKALTPSAADSKR